MCRTGHPLTYQGTGNSFWGCDGRHKDRGEPGCKSVPFDSQGPRFRCINCDYDLCGLCYCSRLPAA